MSKKETKEETSQTMEVDLNVLIKFIGTFDGSRETLIPFLNNCGNAINLASHDQQVILFKYIQSRLIGKAEAVCAIKEFSKWSQLEEFLKTQFGDRKHYAHLLADLQSCKQAPTENVSRYSLKIESCLSKLLTEINISIPTRKKDELSGRVATMQDLALNVFMMGLDSRLSTIIRCRDPNTLNDAISFAIAEEKILGITYKTNSFSSNGHKQIPFRQNNINYKGLGQQNFNRQITNQAAASSSQPPVCRYCKNIGHTIENCRKRQFNNNRRNQNINANYSRNPSNFNRAINNITYGDPLESHCTCHYEIDNNIPSQDQQNDNNDLN